MADLVDVEQALVKVAADSLYPNGNPVEGQAFAPSVTTDSVRIFAGWPNPAALDKDLNAGVVNISVFPMPRGEKNTTRFPKEWQESDPPVTTITAALDGQTITLGGEPGGVQYVTVIIGQRGIYSYPVSSNDTLETAAVNLAALISADYPATAIGAQITVQTSATIVARVGSTGTSWMELRRQEKSFMISIWAATPAARLRVSRVVDTAFARLERLTLADKSSARLIYQGTVESDDAQRVRLYRRDIMFSVEYPTTDVRQDYQITAIKLQVQGGASPPDSPVKDIAVI